jgi:branched-chain amino acid transport system substrate-binding protein
VVALAALIGCDGGGGAASTGSISTEGSNVAAGSRPAPTGEGNTASGDTVVIGLVASQNGDLRPWGVDCVAGAQLAIDEFNEAGGLNGKKVELRIEDSASNPEQGKSATEKLISDGALGIIGEVSSSITAQMAQVCFEKGVPIVAVGATNTNLAKTGSNFFRVCYTDDLQGPVMAKFAYESLNLRKVALFTDNKQDYSKGLSASFRDYFQKLGGEIVDEQFYESGQTQFSGQLTNLKSKNPDGLFLSGYFNEVGPIVRQARQAGITVPVMGGDGWDSSEILNTGGDAIIGGFFCNHYNNEDDRPQVKDFLSKWKAKYPSNPVPATTMGALGYDATALTLDALKRASGTTSKDLMAALAETESYPAVSGDITLKGQNGNPPKRAIVVELNKEKGQVFAKAFEADELK